MQKVCGSSVVGTTKGGGGGGGGGGGSGGSALVSTLAVLCKLSSKYFKDQK
jgi:molybdenum-dependent DNA-binding transcriptional regulator ModE